MSEEIAFTTPASRATLKPLVEAGLDPMKKSKLGQTPFYEAVESGDIENVSLMLDAGAIANDMSRKGIPAIPRAISLGYREIVEILPHHHAAVNLPGQDGLTCLHVAMITDQIAIVRLLLANSADLHARSKYGWTALGLAVAEDKIAIAALLISQGAHINTSTDDGWTPLHMAAEQTDSKIMALLLEKDAEVDAENCSSYTNLFSAIWACSLPCVKMLLSHGASVAKINNQGDTVLDEAFEVGDKGIIECLLDHHAWSPADHIQGTEASLIDIQRQPVAIPISKAILRGDEELALQLVNSRESASSQSDVDIALRTCNLFDVPSLVTGLLEKGASLMATTYNKRTPLHFAAKCNSLEMTKNFIERGAIVQAVDMSSYTPLDLSLSKGLANIEITKYLFEHGALATQSGTQDKALVAGTKLILEGRWEGTYTYSSWKKGDVDLTALSIQFDPNSID